MSRMLKTRLEPNDIIKRSKNDYNWKVIVELGAGGFGTVNKVIQVNDVGRPLNNKEFAMKTELKAIHKQASRLKIERNVMACFPKFDPQFRGHFPELIDLGQTVNSKWIVMTLVGPSLEKLKRNGFSRSTALQCGLQTLKAIHDFHQVGFLHRDIKPGNYCVGADGKADIIFLIDFGLARKYRLNNGTIRPPRQKTKMVGTPRYCPRASHRQEELARKDDYESWLFMMFDLFDSDRGVPWKGKPKDIAYEMKIRVFDDPRWMPSITSIPQSFMVMGEYMNGLEYLSDVEVGMFRETITDYARTLRLTLKEPLDWMATEDTKTLDTTTTTSRNISVDDNKSICSEGIGSDPESSQEMKSRNARSRGTKTRKPGKPGMSVMTFETR